MATSADTRARVVRLSAFVVERFLPVPTVVMIVILTWCCIAAGHLAAGAHADTLLGAWPAALVTGAVTLLLLFRLRVFDDVKDADYDRVHELERPIPRGLVTERELNWLAVLLAVIEGSLAACLGWVAFVAWAIALVWTVLMRVEFFCGEWLEARPTLYASTHTFSGAPIALFGCIGGMVMAGSPPSDLVRPFTVGGGELLPLCLAMFLLSLGFEFGRKFPRYLEELRSGAWWIWGGTSVVSAALLALTSAQLDAAQIGVWMIAATAVVSLVTVLSVQRRVTAEPSAHADAIELVPGVLGLLVLLATAIVLTLEATA